MRSGAGSKNKTGVFLLRTVRSVRYVLIQSQLNYRHTLEKLRLVDNYQDN